MFNAGVDVFPDLKPDVFGIASPPSPQFPAPLEEESLSSDAPGLGSGLSLSEASSQPPVITHPSFYTSREYKRKTEKRQEGVSSKPNSVKGSRGSGILLTPTPSVFNVYNTGDSLIE